MARMLLSLETLKDFDFGKSAVMFQQALKACVNDIRDRPGEKKARKVQLEVQITPVILQDGDVVDVEVEFMAKTVVPAWHTAARPLGVTRQGDLFFSADSPDSPHQRTLDEVEQDDE